MCSSGHVFGAIEIVEQSIDNGINYTAFGDTGATAPVLRGVAVPILRLA
jgi:hypothetical protein